MVRLGVPGVLMVAVVVVDSSFHPASLVVLAASAQYASSGARAEPSHRRTQGIYNA